MLMLEPSDPNGLWLGDTDDCIRSEAGWGVTFGGIQLDTLSWGSEAGCCREGW